MAPLRPRSTGGSPTRKFPKGILGSFRTTLRTCFLIIIIIIIHVMPEECRSGGQLESRVGGALRDRITGSGPQGSDAAAAYRGDPTGDFPKGCFGGLLSNPRGHVS